MIHRKTCSTCAHDGQCVDMHYCGGSCWEQTEEESEQSMDYDDLEEFEVAERLKQEKMNRR